MVQGWFHAFGADRKRSCASWRISTSPAPSGETQRRHSFKDLQVRGHDERREALHEGRATHHEPWQLARTSATSRRATGACPEGKKWPGKAWRRAAGIMHKDLKPENVMMASARGAPIQDLHVVVVDFGLAQMSRPRKEFHCS